MDSAGGRSLYDLYKARWILFSSVFVAIFFAFLYIKFMDWCAFQCAWISVIVVGLGVFGLGTLLWIVRSDELATNPSPDPTAMTWLWWGAVGFWTVGGLYTLCLLCYFKSLRVAIRIIETAGDFVADTKRVALVPVFFFFVAVGFTFTWLYGYICVKSIGTVTTADFHLQTR